MISNLFIIASIGMMATAEYHDKIDTSEMVIISALEVLQGEWTPERMLMHGEEVNMTSGTTLVIKDGRGVVVYSPETKELMDALTTSLNTPYRPIGVAKNGVLMMTSHYVRHGREARIQGQSICLFAINDDGILVKASNPGDEKGASTVVLNLEPGEGKAVVYYRR